ncbi:uncharacterized protein LOC144821689 [Lissotriton helveticus]
MPNRHRQRYCNKAPCQQISAPEPQPPSPMIATTSEHETDSENEGDTFGAAHNPSDLIIKCQESDTDEDGGDQESQPEEQLVQVPMATIPLTLISNLQHMLDDYNRRFPATPQVTPIPSLAAVALPPPSLPPTLPPTTSSQVQTSIRIHTTVYPHGADDEAVPERCETTTANTFLKQCIQIEKHCKPTIHRLQFTSVKLDDNGYCQTCTFGAGKSTHSDKVIMLVGATGSGKTTLINGMVNYVLGVQWEDDFRFKLIDEEGTRSQAESQTSSITSYHLIHQEGFQVPYSLKIIDTPGFGDTRGIDRDKLLIEQIREFFSTPDGVDHLDAVCFVVQSSFVRLTHSQRYIFDAILSIFGRDVADNILILVTFADGQKPPVLEAIREAKIPCPGESGIPPHFKFNNSALFVPNEDDAPPEIAEEDDSFDKMFWKMGVKSMKNFFVALNKLETKSLFLTKEVLDERMQLEVVVEGLQPQIKAGLTKQEEIRKTKAILEQNKDKMKANENFEYEVSVTVAKKVVVTSFITNCQRCRHTCHYPCHIADDSKKHKCSAMDIFLQCRVCPGRCIWNVHFNQKYKWIYEEQIEKGTYQELKDSYEKARGEVMTGEEIFKQLNEDLADVERKVVGLVGELSGCLQRLEEIALKPNPLSVPEYIDLLIVSEKEEAKPGYLERIQSLLATKETAVLISKVCHVNQAITTVHCSLKGTVEKAFYQSFDIRSWIIHK